MNMRCEIISRQVAIILFLINFAFTPCYAGSLSKDNTIIMASVMKESSYGGKALSLLFTEAFKRLDLDLVIEYYPSKRASSMVQRGKVAGELARYCNYHKDCPNLIRVEEPLGSSILCAYTRNPELKMEGWESLKETSYRIDFVLGSKKIEKHLIPIVEKSRLTGVAHWSQGLKKLHAGRTDVYIDSEHIVLSALNSPKFKHMSGIYNSGIMDKITAYSFLHIKHEKLGPKLALTLKKMKQEGLFETYKKIAEN